MESETKLQRQVYLTVDNIEKIKRVSKTLGITYSGSINYMLNKVKLPE